MATDLKQNIIDATIEVGAKEGISQISNKLISARCGVSSASIYYYFDLIYETALGVSAELSGYIADRLKPESSLEEQYRQALYLTVDFFSDNPSKAVFYTRALTASDYTFTPKDLKQFRENCPVCSLWSKRAEAKVFRDNRGSRYMALAYYPLCFFMYLHQVHGGLPAKKEIESIIDGMCQSVKAG